MRRNISLLLLSATLSVAALSCADDSTSVEAESSTQLGLNETLACPDEEVGWHFPATTLETEARTECVPRQCHGRARRDLNMRCVQDPTITDVAMVGSFPTYTAYGKDRHQSVEFPALYPEYNPQTQRNLNVRNERPQNFQPDSQLDFQDIHGNGKPLYPTMPYTIPLSTTFYYGVVPPESSVVVWIDDAFRHRQTGAEARGFRCVAFKRDIVPEMAETANEDGSHTGFEVKFSGVISQDCTDGLAVAESNAAKRLGVSVEEFRENYHYFNSTMHGSYDMEGRAAWHQGLIPGNLDAQDFAYLTPECSPNPQDFYYDANTDTYDLIAYYAQREFATSLDVEFMDASVGRRAYLLPGEIKARSDITIRPKSDFPVTLPVDLSWAAVNLTDENPYNPWAEGVDIGGAWEEGKSLPQANYAPENVRASIFIYPWETLVDANEKSLFDYKIGEITLEGPLPEGRTQAANLKIGDLMKRQFMNPASKAYVSGDRRLFRLYYCIVSDELPGDDVFDFRMRRFAFNSRPKHERAGIAYSPNYVITDSLPERSDATYDDPEYYHTTFSLELDTQSDAESSGQPVLEAMRGCRFSTTPLTVQIDRFVTPVEPIASAGFAGSTKNYESGDDKTEGSNDNDSEVNCTNQAQDDCVEVVNAGNRTDGEGGRSNYSLNSRLGRTPGDEANVSMSGEMLGYQLIDPMDPESSSVSFPADSSSASSEPFKITLAPDWDGLRSALQRATQGSAMTWDTGQYGGQMGLGLGWGIKWRWQIGPAPVLVTLSFTVGASVAVEAEFQFAPSDEQKYPCIGSEWCIKKSSETASFRDAAQACAVTGGRLAELSSQDEASAVDDERGSDEIWLGAQLAYRHPKPACATKFEESQCTPESVTEYRWLSNSATFASNLGTGSVSYASDQIHQASELGLATRYPNDGAVVYRTDETLGAVGLDGKRHYLCVYDAAASERFFRWQLALNMGAAAGFGLSGCTPSDNPGFCLSAGFNVVALSIRWVYENIYHWLSRQGADRPFSRRGNTNISIPWDLKLFEGTIDATASFLWFTSSWNIATYDGITAAEDKLYDSNTPVIENLQ